MHAQNEKGGVFERLSLTAPTAAVGMSAMLFIHLCSYRKEEIETGGSFGSRIAESQIETWGNEKRVIQPIAGKVSDRETRACKCSRIGGGKLIQFFRRRVELSQVLIFEMFRLAFIFRLYLKLKSTFAASNIIIFTFISLYSVVT